MDLLIRERQNDIRNLRHRLDNRKLEPDAWPDPRF